MTNHGRDLSNIDWVNYAPVMYHSAFENTGFSKDFRKLYEELAGEKVEAWPHDHIRVDNKTAVDVVHRIGIEKCGKGLTIALVPRLALPSLRILDTDGCEYPDLDPNRYIVYYLQQHFKNGNEEVTKVKFNTLVAESRKLHLKIISRAHLSPGASTSNRYSCLST